MLTTRPRKVGACDPHVGRGIEALTGLKQSTSRRKEIHKSFTITADGPQLPIQHSKAVRLTGSVHGGPRHPYVGGNIEEHTRRNPAKDITANNPKLIPEDCDGELGSPLCE